jgi:hypothetical protein
MREEKAMSTDQNRPKRPLGKLALLVVPILAGVFADGASELLKLVAHGITAQLKDFLYWHVGTWYDLFTGPVALTFCIVFLVAATFLLEKFADSRPWIRNVLLVLSLVIVGAFQPWTLVHRSELLRAFRSVHKGDSVTEVLTKMVDSPATIQAHENGVRNSPSAKYRVDCEQSCWLRLTYDVPSLWATPFVEIDFDADQKVIRTDLIP